MRRRFHSTVSSRRDERLEERGFRAFDPDFVGSDLHTLDERLDVMPSETSVLRPDLSPRLARECLQKLRCDLVRLPFASILGPIGIGARRVPYSLQFRDSSLKVGIVEFRETILNGRV
ncbi:hypothetical protein [Rhizobium sp. YS-1r]|uniref:hypothetical protein n=1 Tax=Rhizobium sp. YS-1r TaxID=1532558 RepID=UPI001FCBEB95|nr:hypothetical protein [Rhizobium sp. YS-1r]